MKKLLLLSLLALLAACGAKIDGTYSDDMGVTSYNFHSGKVTISALGIGSETDYKIEGDQIKINTPQGLIVLDILQDGSLQGPLGIKLKKKTAQ